MRQSQLRQIIREEVLRVLVEDEDFMSLDALKSTMETHAKNILMYQDWLKEPGIDASERRDIQAMMSRDKKSYDALLKLYKARKRR